MIRSDPQSKNIFDRNFGSQSRRRSEPIRGKTNQIEPDRGKKNPHHIFRVCKVSSSATFSPLPYHLSPLASLPCPLHHLAPKLRYLAPSCAQNFLRLLRTARPSTPQSRPLSVSYGRLWSLSSPPFVIVENGTFRDEIPPRSK